MEMRENRYDGVSERDLRLVELDALWRCWMIICCLVGQAFLFMQRSKSGWVSMTKAGRQLCSHKLFEVVVVVVLYKHMSFPRYCISTAPSHARVLHIKHVK